MKILTLILFLVAFAPQSVFAASTPAEEAAEKIANLQKSSAMQDAIRKQTERIQQKGLVKEQKNDPEPKSEHTPVSAAKIAKPNILIFISSSVPEETLIKLVEEGAKLIDQNAAQVLYVIRGEPEIGLKPFGRRINPENRGITLRVDPFLFSKLEIDSVPLVIVDRTYAILHPASLHSAIKAIEEAGYENLGRILAY